MRSRAVVKEDNCGRENASKENSQRGTAQFVAIDKLTDEILTDYARQLASSNIRVDKDLPNAIEKLKK